MGRDVFECNLRYVLCGSGQRDLLAGNGKRRDDRGRNMRVLGDISGVKRVVSVDAAAFIADPNDAGAILIDVKNAVVAEAKGIVLSVSDIDENAFFPSRSG